MRPATFLDNHNSPQRKCRDYVPLKAELILENGEAECVASLISKDNTLSTKHASSCLEKKHNQPTYDIQKDLKYFTKKSFKA